MTPRGLRSRSRTGTIRAKPATGCPPRTSILHREQMRRDALYASGMMPRRRVRRAAVSDAQGSRRCHPRGSARRGNIHCITQQCRVRRRLTAQMELCCAWTLESLYSTQFDRPSTPSGSRSALIVLRFARRSSAALICAAAVAAAGLHNNNNTSASDRLVTLTDTPGDSPATRSTVDS